MPDFDGTSLMPVAQEFVKLRKERDEARAALRAFREGRLADPVTRRQAKLKKLSEGGYRVFLWQGDQPGRFFQQFVRRRETARRDARRIALDWVVGGKRQRLPEPRREGDTESSPVVS